VLVILKRADAGLFFVEALKGFKRFHLDYVYKYHSYMGGVFDRFFGMILEHCSKNPEDCKESTIENAKMAKALANKILEERMEDIDLEIKDFLIRMNRMQERAWADRDLFYNALLEEAKRFDTLIAEKRNELDVVRNKIWLVNQRLYGYQKVLEIVENEYSDVLKSHNPVKESEHKPDTEFLNDVSKFLDIDDIQKLLHQIGAEIPLSSPKFELPTDEASKTDDSLPSRRSPLVSPFSLNKGFIFEDPLFQINLEIEKLLNSYHFNYNKINSLDLEKKTNVTSFDFDSVLLQSELSSMGFKRLLDVDKVLVLPLNSTLRILITSSDVLHAWAVPDFGLKVDAIPGRMNQFVLSVRRPGVFYGQCSELCGVGHGFMPVSVLVANF
jgi:hypothetical protein